MSKISKVRNKIQAQIEETKTEAEKCRIGFQEICNLISALTSNPVAEEVLEQIKMNMNNNDEWEEEELEILNNEINILDRAEAIIYDWIGE